MSEQVELTVALKTVCVSMSQGWSVVVGKVSRYHFDVFLQVAECVFLQVAECVFLQVIVFVTSGSSVRCLR